MNANQIAVMTIAVAAFTLTGCTRAVVYKEKDPKVVVVTTDKDDDRKGPPSHAPAHGWRHKHEKDGTEMVYDSGLDVFVVVGQRDCYFSAGQYFRYSNGSWEWSVQIAGPWKFVASYNDVPSSLCEKHGKGKNHGKDKEKGKDKDNDNGNGKGKNK